MTDAAPEPEVAEDEVDDQLDAELDDEAGEDDEAPDADTALT